MATARTVVIRVEYLGNELGLWCLDCNLSTAALIWFTTTTGGGTTLRSTASCTDCGGRNVDAA